MKKFFYLSMLFLGFALITTSCDSSSMDDFALKSANSKGKPEKCTTIQSGYILYENGHTLAGEPLSTGFDIFGYNYQARIFKGYYANLYLGDIGFPPYDGENDNYLIANPTVIDNNYFMTYYWPYRNDKVNMTWNDAWYSNKDCNGDGNLDKDQNTIGSGAWENYHSRGSYENENGEICTWEQMVKIIAVPLDAKLVDGYWLDADQNEIGENFYDKWAIIQSVFNSTCDDKNGVKYRSPFRVGFGNR